MGILLILLVLLLITRALGEVAVRLGQPAILGELIAGIAFGALAMPYAEALPALANLPEDPVFVALADLGMFFLMLFGGVQLRASELAEATARSFVIATSGLVIPVVAGFGVAWLFLPESTLKVPQCLFVGTALAITAVPVSIRVLVDLGQLNSRAGRTIVSAAILDDVLSLILLAILTGMMTTGGMPGPDGLAVLLGQVALFFLITFVVGRVIVPRVGRFVARWKTPEFEFTSLLLAALCFAVLAESLGLHFILGAFVAGLLFERRFAGRQNYLEVKKRISAITVGFLAPVFFASIGMHLDLSAVGAIPVFLTLLIVIAFSTKLVGAGLPAYLLGHSRRDAWAVGIGMSARGAVELIIADIALRAGLFSQPSPTPAAVAHLFSAIVIVAVTTTVATPFALRAVFAVTEPKQLPRSATPDSLVSGGRSAAGGTLP